MHLAAFVGHHFTFCGFPEAFAKSEEIRACLWCNIAEQFKDDNTTLTRMSKVHFGVFSVFGVVESFDLSFFCHFSVSVETIFILIGKSVQRPLAELVGVSNVFSVVDENKRLALIVLVEDTLESVGSLLQELRPLRFEKLVVLHFDLVVVETFECSANRNCFEEHRVRYLT